MTTPANDLGAERRARLAAARLYLVCDSLPGGRPIADFLPKAIAGGVDVVQLRDKHVDDDRLLELAAVAADMCRRHGALLVVNDRPLVARESGADGVHVGQDDMPVGAVRELVGPDMLIGLSTHAPAEIDAALTRVPGGSDGSSDGSDGSSDIDYIGVGPVHATPTKPGRPPVGLELVRYAAARHAETPFFAIGGIDIGNIGEVLAAGATRVCVLRAIAAAPDPELAARELREQLDTNRVER